MKDNLLDIIAHTSALGSIDIVKVTGTDTETTINAIADDRSVMVAGTFATPNADFIGTFGMPNLGKLKTILSFEDYDETSKINLTRQDRDGESVPDTIHFETSNGDFVNDYRLMAKNAVEDKVKTVIFKGTTWGVEFNPTVASILRLKRQAQANSEETTFTTVLEGTDLRVYFGSPSTHSGNFVFESDVAGTLAKKWQWPVKQILDVLSLDGDKTYRISDQGVTKITVDSGLAVYEYMLSLIHI